MASLVKILQKRDDELKKALKKELTFIMAESRLYHVGVVSNWSKKPPFQISVTQTKRGILGLLFTRGKAGKVWRYVDEGTGKYGPKKRSYYIFPKFAPKLKFQTGYAPKTKPIAKAKAGPGRASGPWIQTDIVLHPGIKARQFTKTNADDIRKDIVKRLEKAIERV